MHKILAVLLTLLPALPALAEPLAPVAPVALTAQAYGTVTVQHSLQQPGERLYSWQPLYPQDRLATGPGSKAVVLFLHDHHQEVVDPETAAQVSYAGLVRSSSTGMVRRLASHPLPAVTPAPSFPGVGEPPAGGDLKTEEVYLSGKVDTLSSPPVFHAPDLGLDRYRHQFFDARGHFLFELTSRSPNLAYPRQAPRLLKGVSYSWQVLGPDGSVLVARYPFQIPTRPLATQLGYQATPLERFLLNDQLGLLDENLTLVRELAEKEPNNPNLRRILAGLYAQRGCPAHARECWDRLQAAR